MPLNLSRLVAEQHPSCDVEANESVDVVAIAQAGVQRLEEAMAFLKLSIRNARVIRARQPEIS